MFLEILTRCHPKRVRLLDRQQATLDRQTCDDWQQTLLIDDLGRGVAWANGALAWCASRLEGEYVWILDDDDLCVCDTLVEDLKRIVVEHKSDVVMAKVEHADHGILPGQYWGQPPVYSHVTMSSFVVRREVYRAHANAFCGGSGADHRFISSVFQGDYRIYWHDAVIMRVEKQRFGRAK